MIAAALLLSLLSVAAAQNATTSLALNEPPDGQLYLGAWIDTGVSSGDSPLAFNSRIGRNASWFQASQNLPADPYDDVTGTGGIINATKVFETNTDAGVYVTVYPEDGLTAISAQDYAGLGVQLQSYITAGHAVFLRFAPEMNGNWDIWGTQPTLFKATWKIMYESIKASCPSCAIVWSPNAASGYPYGITPDQISNATDRAALDTNGDGIYDSNDDAYAPYYPGDEYVDWTGVSYYYKGIYPNSYNVIQQPGYMATAMTGWLQDTGDDGGVQYTEFYDTYCSKKPCMISESGAAWHVNQTQIPTYDGFVSPNQEQLESAWWEDGITNLTFLEKFPRLKMIMLFEWEKVETDNDIPTLRDFRLTNNSAVLGGFTQDLENVAQRYVWANYLPMPKSGSGSPDQVPMPQETVHRATPYRASTPTSISLFSSDALTSTLLGWTTGVAVVASGFALGASLIL
ncbi:glycoside hydrolase family 26 protein [Calocera cornea HHB12733]|uniref:Glycoside hydrolase family 26 protein n=1 Tax=Calocera cornea HHB12733 TaxID=1353952 RepID=A0A165DK20_9BASI|nr:glycoside hydrolase family 26 protein [Calocera cornea HHB12733]